MDCRGLFNPWLLFVNLETTELLQGVNGLMFVSGLSDSFGFPFVYLGLVIIRLCDLCNKLFGVCGVSWSLREPNFLCGGVNNVVGRGGTWSSSESLKLNGMGDNGGTSPLGDLHLDLVKRKLVGVGDPIPESQQSDDLFEPYALLGVVGLLFPDSMDIFQSSPSESLKFKVWIIPVSGDLRSPFIANANLLLHIDILHLLMNCHCNPQSTLLIKPIKTFLNSKNSCSVFPTLVFWRVVDHMIFIRPLIGWGFPHQLWRHKKYFWRGPVQKLLKFLRSLKFSGARIFLPFHAACHLTIAIL